MFKTLVRKTLKVLLMAAALGAAVLLAPRLLVWLDSLKHTYSLQQAPQRRVAIVFGAGLWRDGSPTPVLRDRVEMAAQLFFDGKVEKLLMSGDNRFVEYNEPGAMKTYAQKLGVPESAIVLDYAGRRTYDTCYRARDIFKVTDAILVTQSFHLPRALYTCNRLGIAAAGVASDLRHYRLASNLYWNLRELPATLTAFWEVNFSHPQPVLGNPEPIFSVLSR